MNVMQSAGTSFMVWGCALPVCFAPTTEHINIIGMFIFIIGVVIFVGGSDKSHL